MLGTILIIGSAGSVGHDMMYQIACMKSDIKVVGADINEEKGIQEIEESLQVAQLPRPQLQEDKPIRHQRNLRAPEGDPANSNLQSC